MSKAFALSLMSQERKDMLLTCGNAQTHTAWIVAAETNNQIAELYTLKQQAADGQLAWAREQIDRLQLTGEMDIYSAVGMIVGKKARTIRLWANTAEKVGKLKDAYNQLPFSHFVFAVSQANAAGEKQEEQYKYIESILQASARQMDNNGGYPPSVEWLELNFSTIHMGAAAVVAVNMAQDSHDEFTNQVVNVFCADTGQPPELLPANEFAVYQQLGRTLVILEQLISGVKNPILRDAFAAAVQTMRLALQVAKEPAK